MVVLVFACCFRLVLGSSFCIKNEASERGQISSIFSLIISNIIKEERREVRRIFMMLSNVRVNVRREATKVE